MDRLPSEILNEIVNYLFVRDLNSMRLVSRRVSATANIFKFRAIHVRVSRKGLNNLLNISRQSHLAQCVREITYPFNRLALVKSSNLHNYRPIGKYDRVEMAINLAKKFFHWYMKKYVAQIELEESGECVRALETAFSRMPIIKVIVPGYNNFVIGREFNSWRKTLNGEERDHIYRYCDERSWWKILEPIEEGEGKALKASTDLISIMQRLQLKLDSFEFRIASSWLRLGVFDNNSELWGYASLFRNVTCLSVCISTPDLLDDLEGIEKVSKEGQLHKFLSIAPNLRKLSFAIECEKIEKYLRLSISAFRKRVFPLLDILGRDHVWKYLHTVSLKLPCMRLEEIVGFLGRHESTLDCLHLKSPILLNGTWRELLDFLREKLHLKDFKIVSPGEIILGEEPELMSYKVGAQLKMKNYVLYEGVPFHPMKQELEENGLDMSEYLIHPRERIGYV
ncbi:hypothetical protein RUND412_002144 [Rhizina undulata]